MKDSIKYILLSLIIFAPMPVLAVVQESEPNNGAPAQDVVTGEDDQVIDTAREKQQDLKENQNDSLKYRCSISSSKMDTLEAKYRERFNKHLSTYNNMIDRIIDILDDLEDKNYDVEEARESVNSFKAKVEASKADFESFSLSFQQARDLLCEDDISGYRDQLKQSRNQLKVMRANLLKLRSEFNTDVKPDLLDLKDQIRERYQDSEDIEE